MGLPPGPRTPATVNILRFSRRPLEMLRAWHERYGDVFTVRFLGFGTGVYVADPDAIRALFTGDQSDLRAGEANSFLEPVLGPHSVLILDGPEHLRQRKLLLPPFQGSRVAGFREVIRDVAERELPGWRPSVSRGLEPATRPPPRASPSPSTCCCETRTSWRACARKSPATAVTRTSTPWSRSRCGCDR